MSAAAPAPIVKERPLLFRAPMVRALLAGTKTQTRRTKGLEEINVSPAGWDGPFERAMMPGAGSARGEYAFRRLIGGAMIVARCPYGRRGERLWVKETVFDNDNGGEWIYRADGEFDEQFEMVEGDPKWTPSIHCPRRASRILLELTDVRVERLQAISEADAYAEGIDGGCVNCGNASRDGGCGCPDPCPLPRDSYLRLWNEINGAGAWDANPWVWVLTFRRVAP